MLDSYIQPSRERENGWSLANILLQTVLLMQFIDILVRTVTRTLALLVNVKLMYLATYHACVIQVQVARDDLYRILKC
jgi:hypothetical protein